MRPGNFRQNLPLAPLVFVVALGLIVGLSGCRRTVSEGAAEPTTEVRIISQVVETDDSTTYEVRWFPSGCESFDRIEVEESADEVALTIYAYVDSADCQTLTGESSTTIQLADPIGERVLLDGNLDSTIVLNADPQPPDDLEP